VVMDKGLRPPRRRPGAHFAPKANWMNDPNGLIFWNGQYHLFYQHNPRSTTPFAKICWGHAKSPDLVHWEDLPLALTPTPGSVDEDGCWSGRAVVNNGQVFLLYTGFGQRRQRPCAARALDDQLVSFEKLKENPVIPDEPLPGLIGFRDSAVRRVNGELRQLIGSGSASTGGCLLEYSTKDLTSWDYCGIFLSASAAGLPGQMWECPDFFEVDGRSFLVISLLEGKDPLGVLSVGGAIKGDQFFPEVERRLDIGSRWYAPQSFDAPDGRRIVFGWLREHEDELPESDRGRVGVMSLPRQLFAAPDGTLGMAPIAELKRLQSEVFALVGEGRGDGTILSTTRDVEAVEVEVAVTGPGTLRVDLLDKDGGIVVAAAVSAEGIELGTSNTALAPSAFFTTAGSVKFSRRTVWPGARSSMTVRLYVASRCGDNRWGSKHEITTERQSRLGTSPTSGKQPGVWGQGYACAARRGPRPS
jgi:sucrose-6-phosphate hydrolase SacC (GH32 family)